MDNPGRGNRTDFFSEHWGQLGQELEDQVRLGGEMGLIEKIWGDS